MEPLGRFWESVWSFSRTFGRLLENVSKTIQKVTKVHQKSPKGGPKAPKRLPKSDQKGNVFVCIVNSADLDPLSSKCTQKRSRKRSKITRKQAPKQTLTDDGKRFEAMDTVLALLLGENLLE